MRRSTIALFLSLPLMACQQTAPIEVKDVWARDTAGGTASAAVYMTVTSPAADRLIGASTPAAKKTDLMTMESGGGAMGMKYLDAIDIPAGKPVSLNSGGLHIWLADLNQPLRGGETFPLTLRFEKSGERQLVVSVVKPAEAPPMPM
jgi:copper(I)-binding protein